MRFLARVGLRLVFWLLVGVAVAAVALACVASLLVREAQVLVGRRRAARYHRAAARAGSAVADVAALLIAGPPRTSGRRTGWR